MSKSYKGDLSRYVKRVMKEKRLSRHDVKLRSGGEITDSYVSGIISGAFTNLSIGKLKALAHGLRVRELDLIRVAFGLTREPEDLSADDNSHNLVLLNLTKKMVISNDIAEIVEEMLELPPADRAVVLQFVRRLSRRERKPKRRARSV